MASRWVTVVETPGFLRDATRTMTGNERAELVAFLAANPEAGDVMPDTGGARKLRWRAPGRGKRGGIRVVYYYHDASVPLFLLSVFAKNEKSNLTPAERNEMKILLPRLLAGYRRRMTK